MTEQFTGWQILIHKATELVGDTDGIDVVPSLARYNEAILAAITEAFPGAEIDDGTSGALGGVLGGVSIGVYAPAEIAAAPGAPEEAETDRAVRIVERIFESGKDSAGRPWYVEAVAPTTPRLMGGSHA